MKSSVAARRAWPAAGVLLFLACGPAFAQLHQVHSTGGVLRPAQQGAVEAYLGVPYAASTAGANRWRPPQTAPSWTGVRRATEFGFDCQQEPPYNPPTGTPWTSEYLPHGKMSEDCLFLNVWTAAQRPDEKRPVMMWIHGGGFAGGSAAIPIYRGTSLASRGIVVVSINYRVSVFGFLAHPALTKEAGTSGNYGLLDQLAALEWIKRNIAAFGGDPDNVTIAGQSAGAASVHALIASPRAKGLFRQAIAQSGSGMGIAIPALKDAEATGEHIARELGTPAISAMRALPAAKLISAIQATPTGRRVRFGLVQDGAVLPNPSASLSLVPILTGLNADESSVDAAEWNASDMPALQGIFKRRFAERAADFAALYGTTQDADVRRIARQVPRDSGIAAMIQWAQQRPAGAPPAYAYLFTHPQPGPDSVRFGVFHSAEIPYVFNTLDQSSRPFTAQDRELAAKLGSYWIIFVRTGNPNGSGLIAWPALSSGQLLEVGDDLGPRPALSEDKRALYQDYVDHGGRLGLF